MPWDNYFVGVGGLNEIYPYDFRDPFRFSFDRLSGMLVVADIEQHRVEEIDVVRKGGNYCRWITQSDFLFDPNGAVVGLSNR